MSAPRRTPARYKATINALEAMRRPNPNDMWEQGVVTAVTGPTVTVQIGDAPTAVPGLHFFSWYTPTVGDVVHLLHYGTGYLVLGTLA